MDYRGKGLEYWDLQYYPMCPTEPLAKKQEDFTSQEQGKQEEKPP